MEKYAAIIDGVVDAISYTPDRGPSGEVMPPWLAVPDNVFAGFSMEPDGSFSPPADPPATEDVYRRSIQVHIDRTAQGRGYDSGQTMATYIGSTVDAWAAEARAFVGWRDAVWLYAFNELEAVRQGQRVPPTPEAFCAELPSVDWPS